ncbi:hypothetical protein C8D90_10848 [Enterobacillus tribolii]|uniref:Uncharacterized protein n=1 Tax=Enterobacillus tribolii TaxID=1487935 RepID=A0A370QI67_9GAMM|nr:hypothetical protein C8D90_10848 [Enterobacillus tribolii]
MISAVTTFPVNGGKWDYIHKGSLIDVLDYATEYD